MSDELGKLRCRCDVCGHTLTHPRIGRPRRYCGEACATSARNARRRLELELPTHRAQP